MNTCSKKFIQKTKILSSSLYLYVFLLETYLKIIKVWKEMYFFFLSNYIQDIILLKSLQCININFF